MIVFWNPSSNKSAGIFRDRPGGTRDRGRNPEVLVYFVCRGRFLLPIPRQDVLGTQAGCNTKQGVDSQPGSVSVLSEKFMEEAVPGKNPASFCPVLLSLGRLWERTLSHETREGLSDRGTQRNRTHFD